LQVKGLDSPPEEIPLFVWDDSSAKTVISSAARNLCRAAHAWLKALYWGLMLIYKRHGGYFMATRWLFKTEPSVYSYQQLVKDKSTRWDGVANNLALMHLKDIITPLLFPLW
jgi:hypothetical protein